MGCRRMLGAWDRAAIMAGVDAGLSQVRIAHLIGRSPSVVCREIARHTGPDGQYRAEEADKAARAARRRPKKRLLDCDEILRDRVIADLSQGHTPRRATDIMAYFDHPHTSNGPTEAINGCLEHLRGSALGFRNLTNYITRALHETGGFKPQLHPQL